jgi:hypothetical protein
MEFLHIPVNLPTPVWELLRIENPCHNTRTKLQIFKLTSLPLFRSYCWSSFTRWRRWMATNDWVLSHWFSTKKNSQTSAGKWTETMKRGVGGAGPRRMKMWCSPGRDPVASLLEGGPGIQAHWVLEHLVWSAWLSALPTCQHISSHCSRCWPSFTWPPSFVHKVYNLNYVGVLHFFFHVPQRSLLLSNGSTFISFDGLLFFFLAFQCDGQRQKFNIFQVTGWESYFSHKIEINYGERSLNFLHCFSPDQELLDSSCCVVPQILPSDTYSTTLSCMMILAPMHPKCSTSMKLASGSR